MNENKHKDDGQFKKPHLITDSIDIISAKFHKFIF